MHVSRLKCSDPKGMWNRQFPERQEGPVSSGVGSRSCGIAGHRDGRKDIQTGLRRPGRLDLGT